MRAPSTAPIAIPAFAPVDRPPELLPPWLLAAPVAEEVLIIDVPIPVDDELAALPPEVLVPVDNLELVALVLETVCRFNLSVGRTTFPLIAQPLAVELGQAGGVLLGV